jgi:hypothetical protein
LDITLATFQSHAKNKDSEKDALKYAVKVPDTEKIEDVEIHTSNLTKTEISLLTCINQVLFRRSYGYLTEGNIRSNVLKGSLEGKNNRDLVRKREKKEVYVEIRREDKPKGKVRDTINKLTMS